LASTVRQLPEPHKAFVYHDPRLFTYEARVPFSPAEAYPEYPFDDAGSSGENKVYQAVRNCLFLMGLDAGRFGTTQWDPLGEFIEPGQRVLIKPNFVLDFHGFGWSLESVITHGSIIRAVLDYVLLALKGQGAVRVGDAPLQSADFGKICQLSGLNAVLDFYRGRSALIVDVADFRQERAMLNERRWVREKEAVTGDPEGYATVDLKDESMFRSIAAHFGRYRVTNYDPKLMPLHHNARKNEYLVSGSILQADAVISLPKIKTHRKAGITACLKNSIGINGHKDWLPHHRRGGVSRGGDEYLYPNPFKAIADSLMEWADLEHSPIKVKFLRGCRAIASRLGKVATPDKYFEGGWYGNDTLWRTILDLNRILLYADRWGKMQHRVQRECLFLADGIIAGEGEGPLEPTAKPCGLLVGGVSAPVVDAVIVRLMGFDFQKIPSIREAFALPNYPLVDFGPEQIEIVSNSPQLESISIFEPGFSLNFVPAQGWQGRVELRSPDARLPSYPRPVNNLMLTYRGQRLP
jgi:uncharacterized protein (DUF362 family)